MEAATTIERLLRTPLGDLQLVVCENLKGSKVFPRKGDHVYVSPAVFELLSNAETQNEMTHLLDNIETYELKIGPDDFWTYVPLSELCLP